MGKEIHCVATKRFDYTRTATSKLNSEVAI